MTPKKYANEMVEKMRLSSLRMSKKDAKKCALIAVDEILKSNPTKITCTESELNYKYWQEVKQVIEEL